MIPDRFKFRVWYPAAGQYCANFSLDTDGVVWSGHTTWREGFTIEFCIGLKDKAGKLIYEGDIVHFGDIYVGKFFVVKWQEDMACFAFYEINGEFPIMVTCNDIPDCVEVTGNIHESKNGSIGND